MYICTQSKLLVYESPHVAHFLFVPIPQYAIEEREANFVANSTAFACPTYSPSLAWLIGLEGCIPRKLVALESKLHGLMVWLETNR